MAAVSRLQVGWYKELNRLAEQLAVLVAEHFLQPSAGQREHAVVVCQRQPILESVEEAPRLGRSDGSSVSAR